MDDSHTIQTNQFVHSLKYLTIPWETAKAYSSSPENYGYRPLTVNLSQLSWAIGGGSVIAFQIIKKILLILFALICFLTWTEWQKLITSGSKDAEKFMESKNLWWSGGFLAFGFFLLHPVGTQVGNYIAASSTLLCGLFYMLGFFFYLKFRRLDQKKYLFIAGFAYFLSVMSKEEGITLIAIILITEIFFLRKSLMLFLSKTILPISFMATVGFLSAYLVISHFESTSDIARGSIPRSLYFATQLRAYLFYMSTYFWPYQFNFDNLSFQFAQKLWTLTNAVFLALNAAVVCLGIYLCSKKNSIGMAILGFYIAISPASSVIPLAEAVNDHRHFIPFSFFGFGMIQLMQTYLPRVIKNSKIEMVLITFLLIFLASATYQRNTDYVSNKTLWSDTVIKNPESPRAMNNLALEFMATAEYSQAQNLLNKCVAAAPYYYPCFINMAITSAANGEDVIAELFFKKAIDMDRNLISSRLFYSDFLIKRNRDLEAKSYLEEANRFAQGLNKPVQDRLEAINARVAGTK